MAGFIKQQRSDDVLELARDPYAFTLLAVIAQRARRTNGFNVLDLSPGEALIGDYEAYGMTEKQYRGAKERLKKWGLAAFKGTNKGTIATLTNTRIYDINIDQEGEQNGDQRADEGRSKGDQRATNKKERRQEGKNGREGRTPKPFTPPTVQQVAAYATTQGYPDFDAEWFVKYYSELDWHSTKGKPVVNWKLTVLTWIRRDEKDGKISKRELQRGDPGWLPSAEEVIASYEEEEDD